MMSATATTPPLQEPARAWSSWDEKAAACVEALLHAPHWGLRDTVLARLVLLCNHVLLQEPQAMRRLQAFRDRQVQFQWRDVCLRLRISAAGLWVLEGLQNHRVGADSAPAADLCMTLEGSPWKVLQQKLRGESPALHIAGNVQLAAELNWLAQHLRWDVEEDCARLLGDVPAARLAAVARAMRHQLSQWLGARQGPSAGSAYDVAHAPR